MTDTGIPDALTQARAMHRAGRLGAARGAYEMLLRAVPEDPDIRGLLGVVALQEGRLEDAESMLRVAVAEGGEARVHLRNLNNLLALFQRTGDTGAALALAADGVPAWPEGTVPDAAERQTVLSLCSALLLLGGAGQAWTLLRQAVPARDGDAEALSLAGRMLLALGDDEAAASALERAAGAAEADPQTLIALGWAQEKLGRPDAARATVKRIAARWPVHAPPPQPSHRASVLVLNPLPVKAPSPNGGLHALHFTLNFAAQLASALRDEFRFVSVLAELAPKDRPQRIPRADVVLNNCVNAEQINVPGRLDLVTRTLANAGAPVINHPHAVAETTRQKVVALLQGIPNLKLPRIERYRTDLAPASGIAADIESRFAYPVIVRQCKAHTSAKLQHSAQHRVSVLAADGDVLRDYLATLGWPEIYAIEFVPLRRKTGQFRKIRAVLAEDEVIVAIPGFSDDWMVAGGPGNPNWSAYYRTHPETIEECRRIVGDPEGCLGADCMRTLKAIRDRIPLDLFGIDFDVDDSGRVVVFEANASMNLLKRPNEPEDLTLPDEPFERIKAAFRRAVERRIAAAG